MNKLVKQIVLEVREQSRLASIIGAVLAPWSSLSFCDLEKVAEAFGGDYQTPEVREKVNSLDLAFEQGCRGIKRPGHYIVGWRDGQPHLSLQATCGRKVEVFSHSYDGTWVKFFIDLGGSASSAGIILQALPKGVVERVLYDDNTEEFYDEARVNTLALVITAPNSQEREYYEREGIGW